MQILAVTIELAITGKCAKEERNTPSKFAIIYSSRGGYASYVPSGMHRLHE